MQFVDTAARVICQILGFDPEEVKCPSRRAAIVRQREVVAWCLHHIFHFNFSEIGRYFNQDHSTIIAAVSRARPPNPKLRETLEQVASRPISENLIINSRLQNTKQQRHYIAHGAKCMICGIEDVVEIHHIIPLRFGGADVPGNSILLCPNHHTMLHLGLLKINRLPSKSD